MITILDGTSVANKQAFADSLRNTLISKGRGVLLVNDKQDGDPKHQIEKILAGVPFPKEPGDLKKLQWKADPVVIIFSEKEATLEAFEKVMPGFKAHFGPVQRTAVPNAA